MKYQEMSNTQINVEVAKASGFDSKPFLDAVKSGEKPLYGERFDPCKSWADAGSIAEENLISFDQHYNGSYAKVWGYSDNGLHEVSVLRSQIKKGICIVFLMMKGGE